MKQLVPAILGPILTYLILIRFLWAGLLISLPFFFAAVLAALQLGAPQGRVDALAATYVLLRLAYIAAYVGGAATLRSALWALGFALNVAILLQGWR